MSLLLVAVLSQEPEHTSLLVQEDTIRAGCLWRACLIPSLGIAGAVAFGALLGDVFPGENTWRIGALVGGGLGVFLGYDMGKKLDKLSARPAPPEHRKKPGPFRNTFQRVSLAGGYGLFSLRGSFQHRNFPSLGLSYCFGYTTGLRFGLFGWLDWNERKIVDPETGACIFYSWEDDRMAGAFASLGARQTRFDFALGGGLALFGLRYSKCDPVLGKEWHENESFFTLVAFLDAGLMLIPRTGLSLGAMAYFSPYIPAFDSYGPEGGNLLEIRGGLFHEW